jgi:threonine dehydrogenase-like Zn-dependent dehydrogenase
MQALVYHGPNDLRVEDRPTPEPGPGEAVLRVGACGICGTDLRIVAGGHRLVTRLRAPSWRSVTGPSSRRASPRSSPRTSAAGGARNVAPVE